MKSLSKIICPKHGEFWQKPCLHLIGCGCPKCNSSHLENEIEEALKKNNILYECQKTFDWLKYKSNQYLDFYLPEYKIAIECQGIQHFKPSFNFKDYKINSVKKFKEIINRDDNKRKLCDENGIKILYFSHKNIFIENKSNITEIFDNTDDIINEIKLWTKVY